MLYCDVALFIVALYNVARRLQEIGQKFRNNTNLGSDSWVHHNKIIYKTVHV